MLSNLKNEMLQAAKSNYAIAGFNVFGIEEAIAVVEAAEIQKKPVLLMLNRVAISQYSLKTWADMLQPVAEQGKVPVSLHLDHCTDLDEIKRAVDVGFTSVMYDGSHFPMNENIESTNQIAQYCKKYNVALEGEVGSVPYDDRPGSKTIGYTSEEELTRYSQEGQADWIAVSVGQVHRLRHGHCEVDFELMERLSKITDKPLVIHGGSSVLPEMLNKLCCNYSTAKVNVGTRIRRTLFTTLREEMNMNPEEYDRFTLFKRPLEEVKRTAGEVIMSLGPQNG